MYRCPVDRSLMKLVSIDEVRQAEARIAGVIRRTPLSQVDALVRAVGADVWCKEEQRQRTGSFKIRGAYNHIAQLDPGTHVVAASAGNHAQGVALAASLCGLESTIFMPRGASLPKVTATQEYGAVVELVGDSIDDTVLHAKQFAARRRSPVRTAVRRSSGDCRPRDNRSRGICRVARGGNDRGANRWRGIDQWHRGRHQIAPAQSAASSGSKPKARPP